MPQVFNGVFQAILPLSLLGFRYSIGLRSRGVGLRLCGLLHRLGTLVGHQGLQGDQDAAHANA